MTHLKNESGQGLTEYIVLLVLVCMISITAVKSLGATVKKKIGEANREISKVVSIRGSGAEGGGGGFLNGVGGLLGGGGVDE